jgi:hypothetical protein
MTFLALTHHNINLFQNIKANILKLFSSHVDELDNIGLGIMVKKRQCRQLHCQKHQCR